MGLQAEEKEIDECLQDEDYVIRVINDKCNGRQRIKIIQSKQNSGSKRKLSMNQRVLGDFAKESYLNNGNFVPMLHIDIKKNQYQVQKYYQFCCRKAEHM